MAEKLKEFIVFDLDKPLSFTRKNGTLPLKLSYPQLEKLYKFQRFDTICAALQIMVEDVVLQWIQNCIKELDIHNIALSGGFFMNVKVNQKISELDEVEDLFIFPSCADETNSIGAAYLAYKDNTGNNPEPLQNMFLGSDYSYNEISREIENYEFSGQVKINSYKEIEKKLPIIG
ncbi:MAG: hypothetical protein K8S16_21870 [Bacteroidales bacterium]|nr:hypothetical protein [Bacteroidales bacterium]